MPIPFSTSRAKPAGTAAEHPHGGERTANSAVAPAPSYAEAAQPYASLKCVALASLMSELRVRKKFPGLAGSIQDWHASC
jgi:hypothetical protein